MMDQKNPGTVLDSAECGPSGDVDEKIVTLYALEIFLDFCSESNVYEEPENVELPSAGGPPVQLIQEPTDGFACTASDCCSYAVDDLATIQRHARKKHGDSRMVDVQYKHCVVQQMFSTLRRSYFEVTQDIIPGARPDVKAALQAKFLHAINTSLVVSPGIPRESTQLMHVMGWDKFQVELRMDFIQRQAAEEIKTQHSDAESGGILSRLSATVRDHMVAASTILYGHPHGLSLSKLLLYGDAIPRDTASSDSHWRPVSDETIEYQNFMVQLIRAIIRIHLGFQFDFSFELSAVQTQCVEELVIVLGKDDASPRKRMIVYHNLAWSLVDTDPDMCVVDRWANPIKRAIWLRALRADGNFCEASDLILDLTKLKYLCNMTSLLEALMDKDEDGDSVHFDDHE
ncbi:hypothetical protein BDR07DRAFT_1377600 [Suillus spraguei]|nr:hypothetical protein BDR07DRAFT_1377600 [Suillus spraguei]